MELNLADEEDIGTSDINIEDYNAIKMNKNLNILLEDRK